MAKNARQAFLTAAAVCSGWLFISGGAALAQPNPERNAYFGETHLHTSWSVDAFLFGNLVTGPEDAYKYAKGETIQHPLGYPISITTPLDFMGVTEVLPKPPEFLDRLPVNVVEKYGKENQADFLHYDSEKK